MAFENLKERLTQNSSALFHEAGFRALVEDHLSILRTHKVTATPIPLHTYWKYEGNFYGYLLRHNIPHRHHWIYLRVNGMHSPQEFAKSVNENLEMEFIPYLLEPDPDFISELVTLYNQRKSK